MSKLKMAATFITFTIGGMIVSFVFIDTVLNIEAVHLSAKAKSLTSFKEALISAQDMAGAPRQ